MQSKFSELKKINTRGQVVVEYVLLLIVAVGIAALITSLIASRNPDEPGIIVAKWHEILKTIGSDTP